MAKNLKETNMKTQSTTKGAHPTHAIYLVAGEGKNAIWTKVSDLWPHCDGQGFGGTSAFGRIVVRPATKKSAENDANTFEGDVA